MLYVLIENGKKIVHKQFLNTFTSGLIQVPKLRHLYSIYIYTGQMRVITLVRLHRCEVDQFRISSRFLQHHHRQEKLSASLSVLGMRSVLRQYL